MIRKCPVCGGYKKDHPLSLWSAHVNMHKDYNKIFLEFERYARRAEKEADKRIAQKRKK